MSDNDDEFCIPRSAMYKLVKELVPQVRLSGEAKDLIVTACNEFIHLLATEANQVCEKQSKKLILPDHVLLALDNLGFGEYKEDCVEVMRQMQEETDKRKKLRNRLEKPGIPEEELMRQQNELFAEARKKQQAADEANEEWTRMQHEAKLALQRQASTASASAGAAAAAAYPSDDPASASIQGAAAANYYTTNAYNITTTNNNNNNSNNNNGKNAKLQASHDDDDDNYD